MRTATDHFPGIGRYVASLVPALVPLLNDGEELVVLEQPGSQQGKRVPDLQDRVPLSVSPFSLRQQWVVPKLLRDSGAALYHSSYYVMPYLPGVPTVLTVYDVIPLRFPEYYSAWKRLVFYVLTGLAMRAADRVIAISEATCSDIASYYRGLEYKMVAIPLAADPAFCPQPQETIEAVAHKHDLPARYVLYLGSNKPHKNQTRLVDAWAQLQPRAETLVIAGAWDPRYPQSRERVESLGLQDSVRFLGPVPECDLPALYAGAMLFAFPSEYEGFGLPVLEAMACGTPVVCSNRSSLPEVADAAAICVDPDDVSAITKGLGEVLDDGALQKSLAARGLERAHAFSWERTARETLGVYRALVG